MTADFYCDQVLSGRTSVQKIAETDTVLAFYHTRPSYPLHIVVIPKRHIPSLIALEPADAPLILEIIAIIRLIAMQVTAEHGACRVVTNLGRYQESKHLHWHIVAGEASQNAAI